MPISRAFRHFEIPTSRRQFLSRSGAGFGAIALADLLGKQGGLAAGAEVAGIGNVDPASIGKPHFRPTAKRAIFLFMEGGPSHIDLFDPKPLLNEMAGQILPESFGSVVTAMGESRSPLLRWSMTSR
jgi:hypothetical protein